MEATHKGLIMDIENLKLLSKNDNYALLVGLPEEKDQDGRSSPVLILARPAQDGDYEEVRTWKFGSLKTKYLSEAVTNARRYVKETGYSLPEQE